MSGVGSLVIEPGDHESVIVETEANMLPRVITTVKDGTLNIGIKRWALLPFPRPVEPINFHVTVKKLDAIRISGAGKVTGSRLYADHMDLCISGAAEAKLDITVDELETRISGAGALRLAGEAARQALTISGAGKYHASELSSREGLITISGAGQSTVDVREKLDVTISGCGKVVYHGDPELWKRISGVGKVSRCQN
jgi:hypothetical protein